MVASRAYHRPGHDPGDDDNRALTDALDAARQGDEAAFSQVFRAVQPGLHRYLTALVGADAEDVAAETWAQAFRDLDRFRGDIDAFRGWMARIGRNRAIDHLRWHARRPTLADAAEQLRLQAAADDTESTALQWLSTEAAVAAIAALPRDQAEAVLLRVVLGLDAVAAAKVLGKRPGAVRTAAYRGLNTLARRLGADHPTEHTSDTFRLSDADDSR